MLDESIEKERDFRVDEKLIQESRAAVEARIEEKVERLLVPKDEDRQKAISPTAKGDKEEIIRIKTEVGEQKTPVKNFGASGTTTNKGVIEFIKKEIPLKAIEGVPSIEYKDELKSPKNGWITAEQYNKETKEIKVFKHPKEIITRPELLQLMTPDEIRQGLENKICESITHGIGHNVYNQIMTGEQYQKWGDICFEGEQKGKSYISKYIERVKAEDRDFVQEDFCECFKVFKFDPNRLKDIDEIKYNFVKDIYSSLKNKRE